MNKVLVALLLAPILLSWNTDTSDCRNSDYLLNKVKMKYDPGHTWNSSEIKLHVQEPRVGNPQRHTKLILKNDVDYFEMERFREDGLVRRILTGAGESQIYLNGESDLSEEVIKQYKLYVERTKSHKKFYKLMYGLPMSLTEDLWREIKPAEKRAFRGREAYHIKVSLKEEMISTHWTLIIDVENFDLLAIEFNHPEDPSTEGELITFEAKMQIGEMVLPRIRNWYALGTNEYLGSDIIVEALE